MRNQIRVNKEFYILSRSIDNADICKIIEVNEDSFKVKLNNKYKYEIDESVELFSMTPQGQIYFETIIKNVEDDILTVWFPITYKYLQRREFSRIISDKELKLKDRDKSITAQMVDISAGGLKIKTITQLDLLKEYLVSFDIDGKNIETKFEPIRIEAGSDYFIASGRFNDINYYDRISLVQYCFRKQIENTNK